MKILVVEDSEKLGMYVKRALIEAGYNVEVLTDGKEALDYIIDFQSELDAIILDIMLPHLSGIHICQAIRKKHIGLPVLMLTAKDEEVDKIIGFDSGADDYLTKPFSLQELLARIKSLLRRSQGVVGDMIRFSDVVIDTTGRKVFKDDKEIHLTLKEYELLYLLATHPNVVFEKEQILERVWDMNLETFSNILEVHITHLRKKLSDTKESNLIQSVRGVGYRLNA